MITFNVAHFLDDINGISGKFRSQFVTQDAWLDLSNPDSDDPEEYVQVPYLSGDIHNGDEY